MLTLQRAISLSAGILASVGPLFCSAATGHSMEEAVHQCEISRQALQVMLPALLLSQLLQVHASDQRLANVFSGRMLEFQESFGHMNHHAIGMHRCTMMVRLHKEHS